MIFPGHQVAGSDLKAALWDAATALPVPSLQQSREGKSQGPGVHRVGRGRAAGSGLPRSLSGCFLRKERERVSG